MVAPLVYAGLAGISYLIVDSMAAYDLRNEVNRWIDNVDSEREKEGNPHFELIENRAVMLKREREDDEKPTQYAERRKAFASLTPFGPVSKAMQWVKYRELDKKMKELEAKERDKGHTEYNISPFD